MASSAEQVYLIVVDMCLLPIPTAQLEYLPATSATLPLPSASAEVLQLVERVSNLCTLQRGYMHFVHVRMVMHDVRSTQNVEIIAIRD